MQVSVLHSAHTPIHASCILPIPLHGVDDLQYESSDVQGQGSHGKEEGNANKTEREYCNIMDLDDVSKDGVGHSKEETPSRMTSQ